MTNRAKELITDFKKDGWNAARLYERLFEIAENREELLVFLEAYMKAFKKGSTLFDDGLHYINKEQYKSIIQTALQILQKGNNENAEEIIHYASLQFPDLLHDHLPLIFDLKPNESTYYAEYPWRNLKGESIEYFKRKLIADTTSLEDKQKLFRCLLETRDVEAINFASGYATAHELFDNDGHDYVQAYLEVVGYTKQEGVIKSYCPNELRHFVFPGTYILENKPMFSRQHPTWKLPPGADQFEFGGLLEHDDQNPFFHVITFEQIPKGLNITQLNRLVLGAHIREMNVCGPVFYQHDSNGNPEKIKAREDGEMEIFEDNIIVKTHVSFAQTPGRWTSQSWGSSNNRENLFRLGGEPTWIQAAEVLTCPLCNAKMDFLLQLDADLPDVNGGELMFGSGGICYVFWCDESKVSGFVMQCT